MILPTRHFSPFKLFLDRDAGLALMLNPKVLTTFTRSFLTDGLRDFRGLTDPSQGRWRLLKVPRDFPVAPLQLYARFLMTPGRFRTHAFVRNPYGRLVSAWRNKFLDGHLATPDHGDAGYPRSIRARHLGPVRAFAGARNMPGADTGTLVPFPTFLAYAVAQPDSARDHHWDSQSSVLMTDRVPYTRIWRIEDERDEGFLTIGRALGFPDDWVLARLARPSNPSKAEATVFTADLAALARPLVAPDLSRFGYAEDSWMGR